jgi:REP element-mobilizing transposase RayT
MGEPPRLPAIYLPWEKSVAYFVTLCAKKRRKVLANDAVFGAVKAVIPEICRWHVIA